MSDGHHAGRPQASASSSQQDCAGKRARTEDGVSSCYMFKSQLQEYAQKAGVPTPVYETTKEGPSHEPFFRSTVIVNEVRYDSLLGFMNRKAAEQSAAEVALLELAKSGQVNCSISQPVHETGLCKNLLQEYAQKMSYAIPLYQHEKHETRNRGRGYQCSVLIGGTKYIGAVATSKKEAEIKAARTAWFAIKESSRELSGRSTENPMLTVIPSRKTVLVAPSDPNETANTTPQAKKARFQKKTPKKKRHRKKKPKIQVPENGQSEPISNACHSANGQPGAQLQHMGVSGQYPTGMKFAIGESISNSNPTPDNQRNLQQIAGHGATVQEGGISVKSSHTGWLTLSCGNSGEDPKRDASVATGATGIPSAVGSSTPDVLGDKGCQTANINHTIEVSENSIGDTTMANGVALEDGKLSAPETNSAYVDSHGTNPYHTNGQDSTENKPESKGDIVMASGATEDGLSSAAETQAPDVVHNSRLDSTPMIEDSKEGASMASGATEDGTPSAATEGLALSAAESQAPAGAQKASHGTNLHHMNAPYLTAVVGPSNGDAAMASGATENGAPSAATEAGVSSAAKTQTPAGAQEGSHGTNLHHTNGPGSIAIVEHSNGDAAMVSGATEAAAETQAPAAGQEGSHGTNLHHTNGPDSVAEVEHSTGDAAMVSGATENDAPAAVATSTPDAVRDKAGHTANVHDSSGHDSTGVIEDIIEVAAMAMSSGAAEAASLVNSSSTVAQ